MQMGHALAGARAGVGHEPKARLGDTGVACQLRRDGEQAAERRRLGVGQCGGRDDVLARDQQQMSRRLGRDVAKREDEIVLVEDVGRNLATGDLAEEAGSVGSSSGDVSAAQSCGLDIIRKPMTPTAPAIR